MRQRALASVRVRHAGAKAAPLDGKRERHVVKACGADESRAYANAAMRWPTSWRTLSAVHKSAKLILLIPISE